MLKHSICFLNSKSRLSLKVCGHLCPTIETPPNVLKRREEAKKKKKKVIMISKETYSNMIHLFQTFIYVCI